MPLSASDLIQFWIDAPVDPRDYAYKDIDRWAATVMECTDPDTAILVCRASFDSRAAGTWASHTVVGHKYQIRWGAEVESLARRIFEDYHPAGKELTRRQHFPVRLDGAPGSSTRFRHVSFELHTAWCRVWETARWRNLGYDQAEAEAATALEELA